jgi:membrane peptidoglycan carboxypeptidase
MEIGTGQKAKGAVKLFDIPIPTFGKTGTANRFTNSSFVGLIPGPDFRTGQFDLENGYVIAAYTGYDDNRPMKGKHLAIYGSSGALPLWIDTANAIVSATDFKKGVQPADLVFSPLMRPEAEQKGFRRIPVSPVTGLPKGPSEEAADSSPDVTVLSETEAHGEKLKLKRHFELF